MSLHKKISINPVPDSVIAGPTYFDQALNVLVDECKTSIDKNTDNKEKHGSKEIEVSDNRELNKTYRLLLNESQRELFFKNIEESRKNSQRQDDSQLIKMSKMLRGFEKDLKNAFNKFEIEWDKSESKRSQSFSSLSKGKNDLKNMRTVKLNTQKYNPRNKKSVDSLLVSDRQASKLTTAERLEKAKCWLNLLEKNANWLSFEELMVLATLNETNLTINVEIGENSSYTLLTQNGFDRGRTIRFKNNHYERVIDGQAHDTVADGYCGWHALFGDKNSEGKFELQGGKEYRDLYIKVGINTIDYDNIDNLHKNNILNDFMLNEVIQLRN